MLGCVCSRICIYNALNLFTQVFGRGEKTIDVGEVARHIFDLVAMSMVDRAFELHSECAGQQLILPSSYASSIGLVLNELVLNATEHGFAGRSSGYIRLTLAEEDGYLLEFEDDGIGLPEGFQPEKQRSLGISIMRTLIEGDLGGTIRYANREGGGTRVTIRIPKKES